MSASVSTRSGAVGHAYADDRWVISCSGAATRSDPLGSSTPPRVRLRPRDAPATVTIERLSPRMAPRQPLLNLAWEAFCLVGSGAALRNRTPDLRITSRKQGVWMSPITPASVRRRPLWSGSVLPVGCQYGCQAPYMLAALLRAPYCGRHRHGRARFVRNSFRNLGDYDSISTCVYAQNCAGPDPRGLADRLC